jgi:hypothetical protein
MDFLPHPVAERAVHLLVTRDARLTIERCADDQRLEMPTVTGHLDYFAIKAIRYVALYIAGRKFH